LFNATVEEEVAFGPWNLGLSPGEAAARVEYGLAAAGCVHLRGRAVRHLSSGEQRRVTIAAALAMRPTTLILDEPTANLDAEGVRLVVQALVRLHRRFRVTVVVIEHRLAPFLPHVDRLAWLADGCVVADGPPAETLAQVQPQLPSRPPPPAANGEPLVALREVTAGYNGRSVLQNCSFTLRRGDFAALVGPNGAGKTTLARVLAGLLRPRRGRVAWYANRHGWRAKGHNWRVGFLQQTPLHQLVCDTVEEEVRFGPRNLGTERADDVEKLLAQTGLLTLRGRPTWALSVGQQQRTALAATLSLRPALLILDEPTVGQDRRHLMQVMDFLAGLNQAGQTILLITHNRRLVERYANRVWEMVGGSCRMQDAREHEVGN
jgi:energy-coupling factor transport system ATP-binding protein